jgi:hypothetical protein
MLQTKREYQNTRFVFSNCFFLKSYLVFNNVEKRGKTVLATDNIRRMRFACWITKATDTQSEYDLLFFHDSNGYANAPRCYLYSSLRFLM